MKSSSGSESSVASCMMRLTAVERRLTLGGIACDVRTCGNGGGFISIEVGHGKRVTGEAVVGR